MSIINNSHAIGVDTRNLVLKTRGTLHVKVGDRYYEIDFRNLGVKSEEVKNPEEYIISIDSKNQIDKLEYPGDNKLIIGLDGSLFVTKEQKIIDVTPKLNINNTSTINKNISNIDTASIKGRLYNSNGTSFDFENSELAVDKLIINEEVQIPSNIIKNNCCQTYIETLDDGTDRVARKYQNYDFIEIVEIPESMILKSGVMIKSNVNATISVNIGSVFSDCTFESGGLYILYVFNNQLIKTKLN